uniref:Uncharacterized protein n=1 Tax=Gadus morhua TaxID=8049 RepID=A0A8C5BSD3_GADMO
MAHAGEVEPLDGTLLVVAADHLAVGHLLAQAVGGLVGVDGEVHGRRVALLLGLALLLLRSSTGSSASEPLAELWHESRLSLLRWRRGRRADERSGGAGGSWGGPERLSTAAGGRSDSAGSWRHWEWLSICRERFSTSSVIWVTTWIFSSPSSWLRMSARCSCPWSRLRWAASCSSL